MLNGLIVVAVAAMAIGLVMAGDSLSLGLVGLGILAGILARMAQARAYQTEHMDTLRIQAEALQKLLGSPTETRGQWSRD